MYVVCLLFYAIGKFLYLFVFVFICIAYNLILSKVHRQGIHR